MTALVASLGFVPMAFNVAAGADPDAAFPPVPGRQCTWCDFRSSCPEGRAAAPQRDTWSSLPE